jgi:hypothetical protein
VKQTRTDNDLKRALLFVEEAEERVAKQKELVARLNGSNPSTESAENALRTMENSLRHIRNYLAVLLELRHSS